MATAQDKGNALEAAVHSLESAILKTAPGYSESTFHIQANKTICVAGVHHEIDIWVEVEIANGYKVTYIFECRNRKGKVTKNDVIVFMEKIRAAKAQDGFFVAHSFTRDAKAQALSDPRIRLLHVRELNLDEIPIALRYMHVIQQTTRDVVCNIKRAASEDLGEGEPLDIDNSVLVFKDGNTFALRGYIEEWLKVLTESAIDRFRTEMLPEGCYPVRFEDTRTFGEGETTLLSDGPVASISVSGTVGVQVWRGEIESRFELENRGRIYRTVIKTPAGILSAEGLELGVPCP